MKKIIVLFLSVVLSANVLFCRTASAEETNIDKIRDNMVEAGVDESLVYAMPEERVVKYKNMSLENEEKYYFKISEENNNSLDNGQRYIVEEVTEEECIQAVMQKKVR